LKSDKFELVLQKGVELGVTAFVPFISERCVARKESAAKIERWRKIIQEAAEQSERLILPVLHPTISFDEACRSVKQPALLFWEEEKSTNLKQTLQNPPLKDAAVLNLFIGPEGGFPEHEKELAQQHGIAIARLGKRVLRAETAGLAAISAILYEKGEMG
jgi:16S rRNA (uracil1498-N3)-methyltransferase